MMHTLFFQALETLVSTKQSNRVTEAFCSLIGSLDWQPGVKITQKNSVLTSLPPPNDKGTRMQCAPFSSHPSNRHPSACGLLERRGEKIGA